MAATTYANLEDNVQTTIYGILTGDSNVTDLCNHIVDGDPFKLMREGGFPYVVVNTPTRMHGNLVISNTKFNQDITVFITIASIQESVVRSIVAVVLNSLNSNQATTRAAGLRGYKIKSSELRPLTLDDGTSVHVYRASIGYMFVG